MSAWVILAAIAAAAVAPPGRPLPASRIYSDFCVEAQSDDAEGHEIDLSGPPSAMKARFFWSEGQIMSPLAASEVRRAGYGVRFVVRGAEGVAVFHGRIGTHRLVGYVRDFGQYDFVRVSLPRQMRAFATSPPCGPERYWPPGTHASR